MFDLSSPFTWLLIFIIVLVLVAMVKSHYSGKSGGDENIDEYFTTLGAEELEEPGIDNF